MSVKGTRVRVGLMGQDAGFQLIRVDLDSKNFPALRAVPGSSLQAQPIGKWVTTLISNIEGEIEPKSTVWISIG